MFKTWKNLAKLLSPTKKIQKESIEFNKKKAELDKEDKHAHKLQDQLDKDIEQQRQDKINRANGDYTNIKELTLKENKVNQSIKYAQSDSDILNCTVTRHYEKDKIDDYVNNMIQLVDNEQAIGKGLAETHKVHNLLNSVRLSKLLSISPSKMFKRFDDFVGNAIQSLGEYSGLTVSIFKLLKTIVPNMVTFVNDFIPKIVDSIKLYVNDPKYRLTIRTIIQSFNQGFISKEFYENKIKVWAKYIPGLLPVINYFLGYEGEVQEVNLQQQFSAIIQKSSGQIVSKQQIIDKAKVTTQQIKSFPQKMANKTEQQIKDTMANSSIMDLMKNHKNYDKIKVPSVKLSKNANYYGNYTLPLDIRLKMKLSDLPNYYDDMKVLRDYDEIHINGNIITNNSTLEDLLSNCYSLSDIAQIKDYLSQGIVDSITELLQDYPDIYGMSIQPSQIVEGLKNNFDNLQQFAEEKIQENITNVPEDILKGIAIDDFRDRIKGVIENYPSIDIDISDLIKDRDFSVNNAIINIKGKNYASPLYSSGVVYTIKHPYMEYLYQNDKVLYEDLLKGLYNYSLKIGRPIDINGQFTDFYNYLDTLPKDKLKMYLVDSKGEHSNSDNIKSYYKENSNIEYVPQTDKINVQFIVKEENGNVTYQQVPTTKSIYEMENK